MKDWDQSDVAHSLIVAMKDWDTSYFQLHAEEVKYGQCQLVALEFIDR